MVKGWEEFVGGCPNGDKNLPIYIYINKILFDIIHTTLVDDKAILNQQDILYLLSCDSFDHIQTENKG